MGYDRGTELGRVLDDCSMTPEEYCEKFSLYNGPSHPAIEAMAECSAFRGYLAGRHAEREAWRARDSREG